MFSLPISVCIPVRNEEKNLHDCLRSLEGAFDEIVVVDSNSTDATRQIATDHGAVVLDFQWNGEFPKKRNWALRNYSFKHPWVLFIDADERVTPEFISELSNVIPTTTHVGFWISFTNWFIGRPLHHGDVFRKLTLFRTNSGEYEQFPEKSWSRLDMEVHEHPVLTGTVGEISSRLKHYDYRGFEHYIAKHNEYSTWEANRYLWLRTASKSAWDGLTGRQKFKYRHLTKWWLAWLYFIVGYVAKRGFLDGKAGWTFALLKMRYFYDIRLKIAESDRTVAGAGKRVSRES